MLMENSTKAILVIWEGYSGNTWVCTKRWLNLLDVFRICPMLQDIYCMSVLNSASQSGMLFKKIDHLVIRKKAE